MTELKVYIAEKPSLGRAIAEQLAKRSPRTEGSIEFARGRDWAVCWAEGHLFEMQEPDYYIARMHPGAQKGANGSYPWSFDHLPLLPANEDWAIRLNAEKRKKSLFQTIKALVKEATVLVNAGDPDREGQLLIDEILREIPDAKGKPVRRVLISSQEDSDVVQAIRDERDNADFRGMSNAALARSRADWVTGMNYSRAVTLHAKASGFKKHISIGRVQTPLLGLIVQRELDIRNFIPVDHFGLTAEIRVQGGTFKAQWQPSEAQPGCDDEGRVVDQAEVRKIQAKVNGRAGTIVEYKDEKKRQGPPLPFSLGKIQQLMARKYGYKADKTLEALQNLYEAKLTTYPRSDAQHLPESQFGSAAKILGNIQAWMEQEAGQKLDINVSRKSLAWNTEKVTAHHAIIPTALQADTSRLGTVELNVYREVCKRYTAQFMAPYEYRSVTALAAVAGEHFKATGSTPLSAGWKTLDSQGDNSEARASDDGESVKLPPMSQGEAAQCLGLDVVAKRTEPPRRFTESTLLDAMENIHKFVTDPKVKQIFERMLANKKAGSETAFGIGTPATRHTFAPKLMRLGLIHTEKASARAKEEEYVPETAAIDLITKLPADLSKPDSTALWELVLEQIEAGKVDVEQFMGNMYEAVSRLIPAIRSEPLDLPDIEIQTKTFSSGGRKKTNGGAKKRSSGGRFPGPKTSMTESRSSVGGKCPKCGGEMRQRSGAKGAFLGCSNFPTCKHTTQL